MTKILLCCSAGMSTSLFVRKTEEYAEETGEEIEIIAVSVAELTIHLTDDVSIVVLAPQIRFQIDAIKALTDKPVMVIDMKEYGMMNIKKVIPQILRLVGN